MNQQPKALVCLCVCERGGSRNGGRNLNASHPNPSHWIKSDQVDQKLVLTVPVQTIASYDRGHLLVFVVQLSTSKWPHLCHLFLQLRRSWQYGVLKSATSVIAFHLNIGILGHLFMLILHRFFLLSRCKRVQNRLPHVTYDIISRNDP